MKYLLALVALLAFALPQALPAADAPAQPTVEQQRAKEVWITRTGQRYHRATCQHAKIQSTLGEALDRGLTPCKVCKP
jgi:hypothetical protein